MSRYLLSYTGLERLRHGQKKMLNMTCLHVDWIPNILAQFFYARLYLGIETVSSRLLLGMEGWTWIKTQFVQV